MCGPFIRSRFRSGKEIVLIDLILSLDYEVFGSGAGDVMRDVVCPTSRLLDICDRHGAKVTIMFEVGEYWAFQQYDARLRKDLGYSPCGAMEAQAVEAIARGHDVQLHLHPQWIGARYDQGAWWLHHAWARLVDLPDGLGTEERLTSITGALARGKRTLDEAIKPMQADYECVCLRVGGFYTQPSRNIVRAMKTVGLRADSSVVKGYRSITQFAVDYSRVEIGKAAWWTTEADLAVEGTPGENVIELSVSARIEPYWRNFKPAKLRAALHRRQMEDVPNRSDANALGRRVRSLPSGRAVLKNILRRQANPFDFCKLSCRDMLRRLHGLDDPQQQPVVILGHTKDFVNDRQLEEFLAALSRSGNVRFVSMSESVQAMLAAADGRGVTAVRKTCARESEATWTSRRAWII